MFRPWVGVLERHAKQRADRKRPPMPYPVEMDKKYQKRVIRYVKKHRYKQHTYEDLFLAFRKTKHPHPFYQASIMKAVSHWAERGLIKVESVRTKIPATQRIMDEGQSLLVNIKQWAYVTHFQYIPQKRGGRPKRDLEAIKTFGPLGAARLRLRKKNMLL